MGSEWENKIKPASLHGGSSGVEIWGQEYQLAKWEMEKSAQESLVWEWENKIGCLHYMVAVLEWRFGSKIKYANMAWGC